MTFSVLEDLHISSSAQPDFPNLSAIQYLAFATPSFMVKKKNGYTILNPANGIFGFGHYPRLPTVYNTIGTYPTKLQLLFQKIMDMYHLIGTYPLYDYSLNESISK